MPITVVIEATINEAEPQAFASYIRSMQFLLRSIDAHILSHSRLLPLGVTQETGKTVIMVSFPNFAVFEGFLESQEFKELKELRQKAYLDYKLRSVANSPITGKALHVFDRDDSC